MYDVITIGSAVVDIVVHSDQFESHSVDNKVQLCQTYGDKVEIDSLTIFSGGGGSNTAVAFQRMGFKTAVIAELGRDAFADIVKKELETEGVSSALLIQERKEQTGGSIVLVGETGERVILVHRGAAAQLGPDDIPTSELEHAHWLHISSLAGQQEVLKKVFTIARHHAVRLSWNPGQAELALLKKIPLSELGIWCQVLFVNQEEWESIAKIHDQVREIIDQIVITNGKKGGHLLIKHHEPLAFAAKTVEVVDTTGAGDSFAAGYVSALLLEKSPRAAVEWGLLNATSNIQVVGAKTGLLTRAEVEKMV